MNRIFSNPKSNSFKAMDFDLDLFLTTCNPNAILSLCRLQEFPWLAEHLVKVLKHVKLWSLLKRKVAVTKAVHMDQHLFKSLHTILLHEDPDSNSTDTAVLSEHFRNEVHAVFD